jgi:hypothetical protein
MLTVEFTEVNGAQHKAVFELSNSDADGAMHELSQNVTTNLPLLIL